jgi:hypothetical protein
MFFCIIWAILLTPLTPITTRLLLPMKMYLFLHREGPTQKAEKEPLLMPDTLKIFMFRTKKKTSGLKLKNLQAA